MLHQLYRYANDHNLPVKYGFKSKICKWIIELDSAGELIGVRQIDRTFLLSPDLSQQELVAGGVTKKSHFLLDTRDIIDNTPMDSPKHKYFVDLIEQAAAVAPNFRAIAVFLQNESQMSQLRIELDAKKAKSTDKLTFCVDGVYSINLTSWHDWWQTFKRSLTGDSASKGSEMLCLLDGIPTVPVASHGKINISRAGGIPTGSVLVGFDKEAFSSFGLNASANAAMSENAVLTYTAALNHMIQNAAKPLDNVLILHGYDKPIPLDDDIFNLLGKINSGDDKAAQANAERKLKELVDTVRQGKRPEYLQNRYYVFMVTGALGRVMVRDYFEGDCKQLVDSFNAWFSDLALVS